MVGRGINRKVWDLQDPAERGGDGSVDLFKTEKCSSRISLYSWHHAPQKI